MQTENVESNGQTTEISGGLRLGIYEKAAAAADTTMQDKEYAQRSLSMRIFRYGERLRFPAKLRAPRNFRNPGAFDYAGYLADNGITVLGSTRADRIEPLRLQLTRSSPRPLPAVFSLRFNRRMLQRESR